MHWSILVLYVGRAQIKRKLRGFYHPCMGSRPKVHWIVQQLRSNEYLGCSSLTVLKVHPKLFDEIDCSKGKFGKVYAGRSTDVLKIVYEYVYVHDHCKPHGSDSQTIDAYSSVVLINALNIFIIPFTLK